MTKDTDAKVIFYAVGRKFIETKKSLPQSEQLVYYSLAIGHHVGIIDCLEKKLTLPLKDYATWISHLEAGEAKEKLEGINKFGEITINSSHIDKIAFALDKALSKMNEQEQHWSQELIALLGTIKIEPAIYLTVRTTDV